MMADCEHCGSVLDSDIALRCPVCGRERFCNVHHARRFEERDCVDRRYRAVVARAAGDGRGPALARFEAAVQAQGTPVINVDALYLRQFFTKQKSLYRDYASQQAAGMRLMAAEADHKRRMVAEAFLFPGYEGKIVYAALSLDGDGLFSYGPCAMSLKTAAYQDRTTVMEDNSFQIAQRPEVAAAIWNDAAPRPVGYRATWDERHKLAVAKLGDRVSDGMSDADQASLLLKSDGNRANDDFMETHIFGGFGCPAVDGVRVRRADVASRKDGANIRVAGDNARRMGVRWEEK
jgi:hypothetical protein